MKLLAAVMAGIKERIAADPYASRFALTGPLRRYGQLKGPGLRTATAMIAMPCSRAWCSASLSSEQKLPRADRGVALHFRG